MSSGIVKEYNVSRGYGYITDSMTGETLTVYANSVDSETGLRLAKGQMVEYQIEYHRTENWAVLVKIVPAG